MFRIFYILVLTLFSFSYTIKVKKETAYKKEGENEMKKTHVRQLEKEQKLQAYKHIKKILIQEECYTLENLKNALDEKIANIY